MDEDDLERRYVEAYQHMEFSLVDVLGAAVLWLAALDAESAAEEDL